MRSLFNLGGERPDDDLERAPLAPGRATLTGKMPPSARGIARAVIAEGGIAPGAEPLVDRAGQGGGAALPDALRGRFERSLGTDLGGVRVHTDGAAADASAALGARAYAVGQDVFVGAGQYRPDTEDGARLLAHEVAHTVQQRGAAAAPQAKLEVSAPGDALELEADVAAVAMMSGLPTRVSHGGVAVARVMRDPLDGGAPAPAPDSHAAREATMDAGVPAPWVAPTPTPAESTSLPLEPRDWLADARARAAGLQPDDRSLRTFGELSFPDVPEEVLRDPALGAGWNEMGGVVMEVSWTWSEAVPELSRYLSLPTDPEIAGGGGRHVSSALGPDGGARPISDDTRHALFASPEFQATAARADAAAQRVEAEMATIRGAVLHVREANHAIAAAASTAEARQAQTRREQAQGRRADAEQQRAENIRAMQNFIRMLEFETMFLAGGLAAGPSPQTFDAGLERTVLTAPVSMGASSGRDLTLAIAEVFVSDEWDQRIRAANAEIDAQTRQMRSALSTADENAIEQARAQRDRAQAELDAATHRLEEAHHLYRAETLASAGAAAHARPGPGGSDAQATIASQLTVQARIGTLHELQSRLRVPSYTASSGYGFALWEGHEGGGDSPARFRDTLARLVMFAERFVPAELALWEQRLHALSAARASLSPRGA
jgi:hypothetical protein